MLQNGGGAIGLSGLSAADDGVGAAERRRQPGWLVVGATSRNAGKTQLACAIVEAFSHRRAVVGVKVTAITEGPAICPRGGKGCGICAAFEGTFDIVEETGEQPGKDTARMLASGASRVFWIRCRRQQIHAALNALARRLGPGVLVVAESNSLARAIEPDLLLMVKDARGSPVKASAAEVLPLAHRLVFSTGHAFDLNPTRHLAVVDGEWRLVEASAAILAGGRSRRMGRDKSLIPVNGKPLIHRIHDQLLDRFDDILISTNDPDRYAFLGARTVRDRVPGNGPLMGIASAIEAARHDRVFVTACDIPVIDLDTVVRMLVLSEDADCIVPITPAGLEPLFAVYRTCALPAMREALAAGERRISAVFPRVRTRFFSFGQPDWYRNLNTAEDLSGFLEAAALVGKQPAGAS